MKLPFKVILILFLIFQVINPTNIFAVEYPFAVANNPYGIHIIDENDLDDAAKLVNSGGGDWGYVTFVIRKDERDTHRWQKVFDKMRRLHLIPIIRIASIQQDHGWEKLNPDEIDGWISFFESLNWVIQNRYIIIGNEPNHAAEWGGELNPEEYSQYLKRISIKLKASSPEYFVIPSGFDASAPNSKDSMKEEDYISRMLKAEPDLFNKIDGWASHSYPNPNFSASEGASGKGSIRTFDWELKMLSNLGVTKNLPVFISETGWIHDKNGKLPEEISQSLINAFNTAWQDPRIVAVTPFILNYQGDPFQDFSWKKADGSFYNYYYDIQKLNKVKATPKQRASARVLAILIPPIFPTVGKVAGLVIARNSGQTVWSGNEVIQSDNGSFKYQIEPKILFSKVEPGSSSLAIITVDLK